MRKTALLLILGTAIIGSLWIAVALMTTRRPPETQPAPQLEIAPPSNPDISTSNAPGGEAQSQAATTESMEVPPPEPWQEVPNNALTARIRHDPNAPLGKDLIFVQECSINVKEGWLRIPTGVQVRLVEDRGETVTVRFGNTKIDTPRFTLANIVPPEGEQPRSNVFTEVTGFFESLFQPLPNRLGIDVKEIGTGRGIDRTWQTSWGSYSKDSYRTKGLAVEVRNVSRNSSGQCQAEVYWLGRQLADQKLHIHHREVIPLEVGSARTVTRRFWCPLAASNNTKYVILGKTTVAGSKLDGWLVVITRDGKILAGRGSGPEQERIAQSMSEVSALVADYQPNGKSATDSMPTWRTDPTRKEWQNSQVPETVNR